MLSQALMPEAQGQAEYSTVDPHWSVRVRAHAGLYKGSAMNSWIIQGQRDDFGGGHGCGCGW